MAKLKYWVKNLIIVLALVLSLVGVGTGVYFLLKGNNQNPPGVPDRELSAEQKLFIDNVKNMEQVDIDVSVYSGLTLENGETIDLENIVYATEKYLVVVDSSINGAKPTFFSVNAQSASVTSFVSATDAKISIKEVTMNVEYDDYVYISGDYAMLEKGDETFVASLLTGDVVLTQDAFDYYSFETEEDIEVGDYMLYSQGISFGYMLVEKRTLTELDVANEVTHVSKEYILYPLAETSAKIVFDETFGEMISYYANENYLVFITTNGTYVYRNYLVYNPTKLAYELQLAMPVLENHFEECDASEIEELGIITSESGVTYKAAEYYDVQFMSNNLVLVSKTTTEKTLTSQEEIRARDAKYDAMHTEYIFYSKVLVGTNYSIYNLETSEYLTTIPEFNGVVEILESPVENYHLLTQKRYNDYESETSARTYAYFYDSNFNQVLTYNYGYYGDLTFYDGTNFLTTGKDASRLLDDWGEPTNELLGYSIKSNSMYNGNIVVEGSIYYSIYNTVGETFLSDDFAYISQIMNGKVVAFKEATGYYIIDLSTNQVLNPKTPIYNMATDADSLALLMCGAGYYFTYDSSANLYTFNGLDGTTYANVENYEYKTLNGQIYLQLFFKNGTSCMVVSSAITELTDLTEEDIASFNYNLEKDAVVTTSGWSDNNSVFGTLKDVASAAETIQGSSYVGATYYDVTFLDSAKSGSVSIISGVSTTSLKGSNYGNTIGVTFNIDTTGNPTYSYDLSWDFSHNDTIVKDCDEFGISVAAFSECSYTGDYYGYFECYDKDKAELNRGNLLKWWKYHYPRMEFPYGGNEVRSRFTDAGGSTFNFYKAAALKTPYGFIILMRYYFLDDYYWKPYVVDLAVTGFDQGTFIKTGSSFTSICNTIRHSSKFYFDGADIINYMGSNYCYTYIGVDAADTTWPVADLYDSNGSDYYSDSAIYCVTQRSNIEKMSMGVYATGYAQYPTSVSDFTGFLGDEKLGFFATVTGHVTITPFKQEFKRYYGDTAGHNQVSNLFDKDGSSGSGGDYLGTFIDIEKKVKGDGFGEDSTEYENNCWWRINDGKTNYSMTEITFMIVNMPDWSNGVVLAKEYG